MNERSSFFLSLSLFLSLTPESPLHTFSERERERKGVSEVGSTSVRLLILSSFALSLSFSSFLSLSLSLSSFQELTPGADPFSDPHPFLLSLSHTFLFSPSLSHLSQERERERERKKRENGINTSLCNRHK